MSTDRPALGSVRERSFRAASTCSRISSSAPCRLYSEYSASNTLVLALSSSISGKIASLARIQVGMRISVPGSSGSAFRQTSSCSMSSSSSPNADATENRLCAASSLAWCRVIPWSTARSIRNSSIAASSGVCVPGFRNTRDAGSVGGMPPRPVPGNCPSPDPL